MTVIEHSVRRPQRVVLRLASDHDGATIANLCSACRYDILDYASWTHIYPYWLVAEIDGLILGAVQVAISLPVGRIEFLAVEPELGHRDKAMIVKGLADQAMGTLRKAGCELASFMIAEHLQGFRKVLEKRGARELFSGTTLVKRLV